MTCDPSRFPFPPRVWLNSPSNVHPKYLELNGIPEGRLPFDNPPTLTGLSIAYPEPKAHTTHQHNNQNITPARSE